MALIIAIAFLGILSIIGAAVIRYANEGMVAAGKVVPEKRAFNVADRAVEFSLNRDIIITLAGMSPGAATLELHDPANAQGGTPWRNIVNTNTAGIIDGQVTDLGPGDLPAGAAGMFGSDFSANFYQVQVRVGTPAPVYDDTKPDRLSNSYRTALNGNSVTVTHVNASIVRLFKLDDDTIFRTSGGG